MGVFTKLFGGKKSSGTVSALAMPFFPTGAEPDIQHAIDWVRTRFPDSESIEDVDTKDGAMTAEIPGGRLGVVHVPAQIPRDDLEGPLALAWHWPGAQEAIEGHESHAVCFASSSVLPLIAVRLFHSRFVAGLAATAGASGVYVGSALLVREPTEFISEVQQANAESLPLLCWVGFNPVGDGEERSGYTTGMKDFGLLELEIRHAQLGWSELMDFLVNIAHYEITSGIQIGDGETLGFSETDRRQVQHVSSEFIPDATVALITS